MQIKKIVYTMLLFHIVTIKNDALVHKHIKYPQKVWRQTSGQQHPLHRRASWIIVSGCLQTDDNLKNPRLILWCGSVHCQCLIQSSVTIFMAAMLLDEWNESWLWTWCCMFRELTVRCFEMLGRMKEAIHRKGPGHLHKGVTLLHDNTTHGWKELVLVIWLGYIYTL